MKQQRHAPPAGRLGLVRRDVEGIGLKLPDQAPNALRPGAEVAGQVKAHVARVEALAELVVAGEDAVYGPGPGYVGVGVGARREPGEVHVGEELAEDAQA